MAIGGLGMPSSLLLDVAPRFDVVALGNHLCKRFLASYNRASPMAVDKSIGLLAMTLALILSLSPLTKQLTWRIGGKCLALASSCSNRP